jgi:hypothetical protein
LAGGFLARERTHNHGISRWSQNIGVAGGPGDVGVQMYGVGLAYGFGKEGNGAAFECDLDGWRHVAFGGSVKNSHSVYAA